MGVADGVVTGVTQIRDRGPESTSWNLVVVGDGFTSAEQTVYQTAVDTFVTELLASPPFDESIVSNSINVFRVDVESNESGADNPATCPDGTTPFGGAATTAATYFDAEYCSGTVRRLLTVDEALVVTEVNALVPEWDAIVAIVNHYEWGGAGSPDVAVYSLGAGPDVAIHELGHEPFGLADEYESYAGCSSGETTQDNYTGGEPYEPNVTIDTNRATLKWGNRVDATTALPTTTNSDCTQCDTQLSPVPAGTIGCFEGAFYHHCGAFRPAFDCKMRVSSFDFCRVCQDVVHGIVVQTACCFVATAVYGDPWHPDVAVIRSWRDRHLASGAPGRFGMRVLAAAYQWFGPRLARRVLVRPRLAARLRAAIFQPWAALLRRRAAGRG